MKDGKVDQPFEEQINELAEIKKKYPDIVFPFICADPRRNNIVELVKNAVNNLGFAGIKLYPPLGYYPFDQRLYPVYEFAQEKGIPVISHCSKGVIYYHGKIKDEVLVHPKTGERLQRRENKDFFNEYTNPDNYKYLLKDFPKLKVCLAHFGGETDWNNYLFNPKGLFEKESDNWFWKVRKILEEFPNAFADISFTLNKVRFLPLLKVLMLDSKINHKILFGTDYYMVELETSERAFSLSVRAFLGEENFKMIAHDNPRRFLFEKT